MKKLLIATLLLCWICLAFIPQCHATAISIFWYDSAENASEWSENTNVARAYSAYAPAYIEGSGCMHIFNKTNTDLGFPSYNASVTSKCTLPTVMALPTNSVLGACWYFNPFYIPSSSSFFYFGWYDAPGNNYVRIKLINSWGANLAYTIEWQIDGPAGGSGYSFDITEMINHTVWWEVQRNGTFRFNGVTKPYTFPTITFSPAYFQTMGDWGWGGMYFDYLRLASDFEYPPSITYSLSMNAYANAGAGNASISVQTIIDGYYYTTPISINHTAGNFTVEMAQNYGYNATHDVYFSEWTDGTLSNSRTVNFTGALSLGANYGFIRHADFGGYFNFFLGVFGLILMGGGVIALKICWDDHNFAWGLGICLACEVIGLGFCTILVGG